jgi:hypothetical protein
MTRQSTPLRNQQPVNGEEPPIQLYRPVDSSCHEAKELLERIDLLDDDILHFLEGKPRRPISVVTDDENTSLVEAFHERRQEIRELSDKIKSGGARIDEDGRLVPVTQPPQPPRVQLLAPPHPQPQPAADQNVNNEEEEQRLHEQDEREAAEAIARAVRRYRDEGVPENEFELILVRDRPAVNLTFRRVCCAGE